MNTNQIENYVDEVATKVEKSAAPHLESAREVAEKLRVKSEDVIDESRLRIQENPMSCVVGAIVFGFALGCLVMSGRRTCSPPQRLVDRSLGQANDLVSSMSDRLSRAASNLKIW